MAKNDEITTRFKADIKDFKKNIQEAGKQMTLINSKFIKASDGTKKWENSVDGLGAKVNQLKGRLEQHNKKLEDYKNILKSAQKYEEESKQKVEELEKALEKAKQEYGEDSKEVKKLERQLLAAEKEESKFAGIIRDTTVSINKEEGAIKRTTAELNEYDNKLQETKKAQTLSGKASTIFNKSVSAMGEKLKGFAGNVVQYATDKLKELGEETIENGKKFTSAMSKVKAISSSNSGEFKKLSNKALEMGKNTKFSATESAEAFTYMSMAGWKTKDMLDGIEGIMNLAAASGEDLAKTSDIVTDSLTAFGLKAKDTNRFVDVLAQASRNSNTNVSLMGESFKYVAPIAGQFRYRVEDVALGLGIMANSGIKATSAGTSLRAIFTRLATNAGATKNSIGALDVVTQKLGVRFYDEQGKIRPFGDFLTDLRKKWKGLSDSEKINFSKKIAGMNALSGFNTLVETSDEDFKKLKKSIDGSNGAAKEMADVMEDNLEGDFHKLNSSIESVEQKIYKKLEPALREGAQELKKFIDDFNNGIDDNESPKDFLKSRGKGIYDSLIGDETIKDLKQFGNDVKKNFNDINTTIDNVRNEMNKPFLDEKTINDIKQFGSDVGNTLKKLTIDEKTINDIKQFGSDVGNTFESLYNKVKGIDWKGTWEGIKNGVSGFGEKIGKSFSEAKSTVSNFFTDAKNKAVDGGKKIGGSISELLSKVGIKTKESGDFVTKEIEKNANTSSRIIDTNGKTSFDKLKSYITSAKNSISNNSNSAKDSVKKASASASSSFEKSSRSIKTSWKNATDSIKNTNLKESTKKSGKSAIDGIIEGIESKASSLWSTVKEVSRGLVGLFERKLKINSPSKVMRDRIGVNIGKGIAVGINQSTKTISKSISKLAKSTISDAKSSFTKSGFDTVAKNLINSFNKTIDNTVKNSNTSVKNLVNTQFSNYKKSIQNQLNNISKTIKKKTASINASTSKSIKKINATTNKKINSVNNNKKLTKAQKKQEIANLKASQKRQIQSIKNTASKQKQNLKDQQNGYKNASSKIIKAYSNMLSDYQKNAKNLVSTTLNNLESKYQEKFNKISEAYSNMLNKLQNYGNVYTEQNGFIVLEDLNKQTKAINEYYTTLKKLKGKVGSQLFDYISSLDVDVGKKISDKLLSMSDSELKNYDTAYKNKLKVSENVTKALYDPEVKKLNKEYNAAVDKALKDLEPKLKKMGANAIKGFQSGMKSQTKNLGSDVESIASSVVKQFKKTLKIKSPSRVTKSIGKFVTLGLSDGIESETNQLVGTVRQLTNSLISEAENINIGTVKSNLSSLVSRNNGINSNYVGNGGSGIVNYTFNQTNNSPVALNRLEIYRQTQNQLSFARSVMNNA